MSGNGRPTGTRRSMKATRRKPAASRRTRAAGARTVATTLPRRTSGSRARSSRAARTCARRTIADAIGRRLATPSRSTHRQVTSASAASGEKALTRSITEDYVMFERILDGVRDVSRDRESWRARSCAALLGATALISVALSGPGSTPAAAQPQQRPNIVVIMGDDIGMWNIGAYHRGMMAGRTPNLDKLAAEGMLFTDYYAEASCTAGRANFITGELPIRTGMTTVGQAGAPTGIPAQAPTIATALKAMGYATGQFGKNHLGDKNEFLPTVHGFDEFFGYLYHLDAMEDPAHPGYPQELLDRVGPRNMVHSWATDEDDATVQPRWGKIGKQKIEDAGTLYPKRMETVDDEIRDLSFKFVEKAKADGKPFFLWLNPTRMHIVTHLSEKYEKTRNSKNGWTIHEAGMAQLDDIVGEVMKKLKDLGVDDNTIVVFTTDNGTEVFTWPDGGQTPFAAGKGTAMEGGFRVPAIVRWPGKVPAGKVENGIVSGLDWFPTFAAAAGNPNIV